jgi:hypothetical protein
MENASNENFAELVEEFQEELETPSELHRMAAYHLMQAAKQHEIAANALDNDDQVTCDLHALRAYKHEINGRQYSELAMMDTNDIDDIDDIASEDA